MPEQIIHNTTPSGSALLAYGENKTMSRFLMALMLSCAILITLIGVMVYAIGKNAIPLPDDTFLLAYARSGISLPNGSPEIWKNAIAASKHSPVFLGLSRTDEGRNVAFTISLRRVWSAKGTAYGIWSFQSDRQGSPATPVNIRSIVNNWSDYTAPAWLQIWPGRISAFASFGFDEDLRIGGPFSGAALKTGIRIAGQTVETDGYRGDNFIRASAFPGAWPRIEPILRSQGLQIFLDNPPSVVAWKKNQNQKTSFYFEFDEPLATTTKSLIAGGYGLTDQGAYSLYDGTILNEMRLPIDAISQSTSQTWELEGGEIIQFKENTATLGNFVPFEEARSAPANCKGAVIAAFDGKTTSNLIRQLGIVLESGAGGIVLTENSGRLNVCF